MDIIKQFLYNPRQAGPGGRWLVGSSGCNGDNPIWLINSIPRDRERFVQSRAGLGWTGLGWAGVGEDSTPTFALHTSTPRLEAGWSHRNIANIIEMKHWLSHCSGCTPGGCRINHLAAAPSPPLPWQGFLGWSRCAHCAPVSIVSCQQNCSCRRSQPGSWPRHTASNNTVISLPFDLLVLLQIDVQCWTVLF